MSRQLTSDPSGAGQPLFVSSSTQVHALGERAVTADGRVFRYAKAGASDLVAGNLIQSPAQIANHLALTPTAAAIGATSISVTLGATLASANQYAGGWAIISTTPGNGYAYPIAGHAAAAQSAAVTLQLEQPLIVALTSSSRVDLQMNPYNGVIQVPVTTLTGTVVGAAPYIIAASEYGWIQTRGPAGVLVSGTPGVGLGVGAPTAAAGAVSVDDAATAGFHTVGTMLSTGVSGKNNAVMLVLE